MLTDREERRASDLHDAMTGAATGGKPAAERALALLGQSSVWMTMLLSPGATVVDVLEGGARIVTSGPVDAPALPVTTTERRLTAAGLPLSGQRAGRIAFSEACRIASDHGLAVVINPGSVPNAFITPEDAAAIAAQAAHAMRVGIGSNDRVGIQAINSRQATV